MLVFMNAFTNKIEARAEPVGGITYKLLLEIETACADGRAHSVADDMLAIMKAQPHPDCFLAVVDR